MPARSITIEEFIEESRYCPVFDVRSPSEFNKARFPGAINLPLFKDDERSNIGTLYKQLGKELAIREGLRIFGPNLISYIQQAETFCKGYYKDQVGGAKIILYCWRGGMRSAAMSWLLDLYGFNVSTLVGGYKVFRHWALDQLEKDWKIKVLGGYTGSGKTRILRELELLGDAVIDLERLANHRGSAFGRLGQGDNQPSQEYFENLLALELFTKTECVSKKNGDANIWIEDESQRIGNVNIPKSLWIRLKTKRLLFLDIPENVRLNEIINVYGEFSVNQLKDAVLRIQKRLGGDSLKVLGLLDSGDIKDAFIILLKYYDRLYIKSLNAKKEEREELKIISFDELDACFMAKTIQKLRLWLN